MNAILVDKKVVPEDDIFKWAMWYENKDERIVKQTRQKTGETDVMVSTVFLGIDHGFGGKPLWFETMIFGGPRDQENIERYETWDEAENGHEYWCKMVFGEGQDDS